MFKRISFKSKYGWVSIEQENKKITSVSFGKTKNIGYSKKLINLKKLINGYFLKRNKKIKVDISLSGSKIQNQIWNELKKISYGETKSYGEIAKKLKTSPRYVGKVCGQNKHLIIVPCHRVIRSDKKLGGFSGTGGIKMKQRLLNLEKSI
tara:strand:+ start:430 stop:879 length:450 start_codon:yes stop_codon:yes gene_type:complete